MGLWFYVVLALWLGLAAVCLSLMAAGPGGGLTAGSVLMCLAVAPVVVPAMLVCMACFMVCHRVRRPQSSPGRSCHAYW